MSACKSLPELPVDVEFVGDDSARQVCILRKHFVQPFAHHALQWTQKSAAQKGGKRATR
jgi:hypothetical protein